MIEKVEMKNLTRTRNNLQYIQFVPRREQHSCCDEKDHLVTAVLVHGCSLHCELHTIHRDSGSKRVRVSVD